MISRSTPRRAAVSAPLAAHQSMASVSAERAVLGSRRPVVPRLDRGGQQRGAVVVSNRHDAMAVTDRGTDVRSEMITVSSSSEVRSGTTLGTTLMVKERNVVPGEKLSVTVERPV